LHTPRSGCEKSQQIVYQAIFIPKAVTRSGVFCQAPSLIILSNGRCEIHQLFHTWPLGYSCDIKVKLVFEVFPDEKSLTHTATAIYHDKLWRFIVSSPSQFLYIQLSTNDFHITFSFYLWRNEGIFYHFPPFFEVGKISQLSKNPAGQMWITIIKQWKFIIICKIATSLNWSKNNSDIINQNSLKHKKLLRFA